MAAVALFALLPHTRWRRIAAWGAAAVLILGSLLAFADAVFRLSLGRALNLYLDIPLAADAGRLIAGVAGGGGRSWPRSSSPRRGCWQCGSSPGG